MEQMAARLQQRDQELFQRCIAAQLSKDSGHATIYASECAEMRKIAKIVFGSQLSLEKVILRLQTIEEFGDIMMQIAPAMGIVLETKERVAGIVPEVAHQLEDVTTMLSDMSLEVGEAPSIGMAVDASNDEARKVLEESGVVAEQKIKEKFPDIPSLNMGLSNIEFQTKGDHQPNFEDKLLVYLKTHGGDLDLNRCATELSATPEEIRQTVERLEAQGKIAVE